MKWMPPNETAKRWEGLRRQHFDWRWRVACLAAASPFEVPLPIADPAILAAMACIDAHKRVTTDQVAAVADARKLWDSRREPAVRLEAYLLTGESAATVAARVSIPLKVVDAYQAVFYDTTDRPSSELLSLALPNFNRLFARPDPETLLKLAAISGGVEVLRVVQEHLGRPIPPMRCRLNRLTDSQLDCREQWLLAREWVLAWTLTPQACLDMLETIAVTKGDSSENPVALFGSGTAAEAAEVHLALRRVRAERRRRSVVVAVLSAKPF